MLLRQCLGRACASGLNGRSLVHIVRQLKTNRKPRVSSPISKLPITRQVDIPARGAAAAAAGAQPGITIKEKDVAQTSSFQDLKVMQPLVDALSAAGITQPTEIQVGLVQANQITKLKRPCKVWQLHRFS